jgi:type IV pilus assembly protein PilA
MNTRFIREDDGFTLIEILVVILIIGILAAIAIPSFLGQQEKAQDTSAKSNARTLVEHVESCFTASSDYTKCTTSQMDETGLPIGAAKGQVDVTDTAPDSFTVTAVSKSGGSFTITHGTNSTMQRRCSGGTSGCNNGSW